ncbi:MAG: hypothetical protein KKE20_06835 [Nanoarchaeota archaeon]|nr:hypothetical protein [Nanoarchaeota archaeon]
MRKFKKSKKRLQELHNHEREEKKGKGITGLSTTAWMGIFIAVIMIFSVVGYMWEGDEVPELDYNGYSFILTQDRLFEMDNDGTKMLFYNHPTELESIKIDPSATSVLMNARMVYTTLDTNDTLRQTIGKVQYDIKNIMDSRSSYFIYAFTGDNEFNKTIITCSNATVSVPVFYLKKGNETKIVYDNGCFIIQADTDYGMIMLRDRIMYTILGVMQ